MLRGGLGRHIVLPEPVDARLSRHDYAFRRTRFHNSSQSRL